MYVYYYVICGIGWGETWTSGEFHTDQWRPSESRFMIPPFTWDCDDPYGR